MSESLYDAAPGRGVYGAVKTALGIKVLRYALVSISEPPPVYPCGLAVSFAVALVEHCFHCIKVRYKILSDLFQSLLLLARLDLPICFSAFCV